MFKSKGVIMDYIMNGVCTIDENAFQECYEPYACDACPYNLDTIIEERLEVGL
jgi:hypothetical protein